MYDRYAVGDFHVGLPEQWEAVDLEEEGVEVIWDLLEGINTEWAENLTTMFSAESVQDALRFWAMDTEPAGTGRATLNVIYQSQAFPMNVDDLCTQMPAAYEQLGIEMIDAECGLEINGLDAARFMTRLSMGALGVRRYQYIYVEGGRVWTLTFSVDETEWDKYEEIFVAVAETFRVD